VGNDLLGVLNWVGKSLFGMGEGFDALKLIIFALVSPFRLLELGIRGLYVLYLQMKANLGLASKEEKENLENQKTQLAQRTAQFVIDGEERRGVSKKNQLEKAKADLSALQAEREALMAKPGRKPPRAYRGPSDAEKNLQLRVEMLEGQTKDEARAKGTKATLGGKEVEWTGSEWKPTSTGAPKPSTPAKETPKNIQEIAEQTTAQVREIGKVETGTEKTTTAVKELTAKITAQTSVQTTVAAIYNLLASGSLRVNGVMAGMPGVGGRDPGLNTDISTYDPDNSADWFLRSGWEQSKVDVNTSNMVSGTAGAVVSGDMTVNAPITVNGAGKDAEEIATLVAFKLGEAVADARSASIFT
jgi:hypothetical protein